MKDRDGFAAGLLLGGLLAATAPIGHPIWTWLIWGFVLTPVWLAILG